MFDPVVSTEAHLAFAGARTLSSNTADMTAVVVRHCYFLDPIAGLPVMRTRVFSMTLNMLLVFAWARFRLARTFSKRFPASCRC